MPTSASTRGLGMGDANLASRDDDVIFYGPAQLAVARGTSIAGERYADRFASGTVSTTSRLASGGIGVGAQIIEARNVGPCVQRTLPNGLPGAATMTRSLAVVGGALPYKRYRFGVAAKYAGEQDDNQRQSEFLADVGVSRDFSLGDFQPLTAALVVQSIGPDPTRAVALGIPRQVSLGLASGGPLGPLDVGLALQAGVEHIGNQSGNVLLLYRNRPLVRGGLEIGYTWLDGYSFALRAGARTAYAYELNQHFTFGAGLVLDRVSLDYAAEELVGMRYAHRVALRLR
jgi:hypothetical protein